MKLHKDKKTGVYKASFRTASGKTKRVSTRCTDRSEATKVVRESGLEELEAAAKSGRLTAEAIGYITAGRKLTMEGAVAEYQQWMLNRSRSPKTVANHIATVKAWVRDMKLEKSQPASITEKHIDPWVNDPDSKTKASSRAIALSSLRSFFGFASAKGWCVGDPAQLVDVRYDILTHSQKETSRVEVFTDEEIGRVLSYLKGEIFNVNSRIKTLENDSGIRPEIKDVRIATLAGKRGVLQFWMFAVTISSEIGLRLGDICQLEWECFSAPGLVTVWTDKRNKRVSVPISDTLAEMATLIPVSDPTYIFPNQREKQLDPAHRSALSVRFKDICKAAGVKNKSFHCLRHYRITKWRNEGRTLESIAQDVGHASTSTTEGYVHI